MRDLKVVPANEASWDYLRAVFGTSGDPARCWCQRYKMAPGESWTSVGASRLALRLREQTRCRDPGSDSTTGLVAYLAGEPVGWCAVDPIPHTLACSATAGCRGRAAARTSSTTASGP